MDALSKAALEASILVVVVLSNVADVKLVLVASGHVRVAEVKFAPVRLAPSHLGAVRVAEVYVEYCISASLKSVRLMLPLSKWVRRREAP